MSKRTITKFLIASVVLGAMVLMIRPAVIVFHRWRFNTLNDYVTNGPTTVDTNGLAYIDVTEVGPAHEYHMHRLVELGVIAKIEYEMTNLLGKFARTIELFQEATYTKLSKAPVLVLRRAYTINSHGSHGVVRT